MSKIVDLPDKPIRHKRTCPACGQRFLPPTLNHRGFCDAWCAEAWGRLEDAGKLDRQMRSGDYVVVLETGQPGKLLRVERGQGVVQFKGGIGRFPPEALEKIQGLEVKHL
jgi:hypothetical protein